MYANYHTHTTRCGHATGTEREYVEEAISKGFTILGFSDHAPYPMEPGFVSGMRMRCDELEDYVDTVLKLRDEYKDDIEIHLGLEAEYFPRFFEGFLRLIHDYPIEYLLYAGHFLGDEINGVHAGHRFTEEADLEAYCQQALEGLSTGKFLYFAHPDMIRFVGDPEVYDRHMRDLCRRVKAMDIPLEINMLGLWEGRNYPCAQFFKIAGEEGCRCIFGSDAHQSENILNPLAVERGAKLVEECHLTVMDEISLGERRP